MQHGEIGVGTFFPTHQQATKSVEPAVGSLNDPAARLEAGISLDHLCLFPAHADVGGEAEGRHKFAYLIVIVPLIKTQPLRRTFRWTRTPNHDRFERLFDEFHVVPVGTIDHARDRDTAGFGEETSLDALLTPIRRVFACFFEPASGALVMAPSIDNHLHPNPLCLS